MDNIKWIITLYFWFLDLFISHYDQVLSDGEKNKIYNKMVRIIIKTYI